jgi:hypothetical protein
MKKFKNKKAISTHSSGPQRQKSLPAYTQGEGPILSYYM